MSYLPFGATCCKDILSDTIDPLDLLETHKRLPTLKKYDLPPSTDPLRLKNMLHRRWFFTHHSKEKIDLFFQQHSDFDRPLLTPIFSNCLDTPRTQYMQIQLNSKTTSTHSSSASLKSILKSPKRCYSIPLIPNDHGLIILSPKCLKAKVLISKKKRAKIPMEKAIVTFLWQVEQRKSVEYDSPYVFRRDSKYSSQEKLISTPSYARKITESVPSTILRPDVTYDTSTLPMPTKSPRIVKCDPSFWNNDKNIPYDRRRDPKRDLDEVKDKDQLTPGDIFVNSIQEQVSQVIEKAELVIDTVSEMYDRLSNHELVTRTTDLALNVKDVCSMAKTAIWNMCWY
jgi:hypothetical protein